MTDRIDRLDCDRTGCVLAVIVLAATFTLGAIAGALLTIALFIR